MIATVMGKYRRPYKLDNGVSGIACRLSLYVGEYKSDELSGAEGEGEEYIAVKCPVVIADKIKLGDDLSVDLDDGKTRIKSAMLKREDGSFVSLE